MSNYPDLLDPEQRDNAIEAGKAELVAALERRTPDERAAFWKALGIYYAPTLTENDASKQAGDDETESRPGRPV